MSIRFAWSVLVAGCAAGVVLTSSASPAVAGEGFYYACLDEAIPLTLDTQQIAVRCTPDKTSAPIATQLARHGLTVAGSEATAFAGWSTLTLADQGFNAGQARALVAALADEAGAEFVSPVFYDPQGLRIIMTPDLLVGLAEDLAPAAAAALLKEHLDGAITETNVAGQPGVYRVRLATHSGFDVLDAANALAALPEVRFAESDAIVRGTLDLIPNDPQFSQQWGLQQANDQDMDGPEAWDLSTGSDAIKVVILDIGIQQNHPDVHQLPGQDFSGSIPGGGPETMCDSHGTCVAGCVSAIINNSLGVTGIAPGCVSVSAKIGTAQPFIIWCLGNFDSQPSMLANGINYAVTIGARVTNASIGYTNSSLVTTAYANARAAGVVHFAASGNDGNSTISYPASLPTVCAVGALSSSGQRASFSNYGTGLDFMAPGEGIRTTDRTGSDGYDDSDYATVDGTSFASPYTAGVAALILSVAPQLTPDGVEQVLRDTCVDLGTAGYDTGYGWGFINAHNALVAVTPVGHPGDLDCDNDVDFDDIRPFVLALGGQAGYDAAHPDCRWLNADCDDDGDVDFDDIRPFVSLLGG